MCAPSGISRESGKMTPTQWQAAVQSLVVDLKSGLAEKAVLARDINLVGSHIDSRFLAHRLAEQYPTCWVFAVAGLQGASPEMLASVRDRQVRSRVLAGTCPPGEGAALMRSEKNRQEHRLAVQSVVASLQEVAGEVHAPQAPFLLELPNVTHLASDVVASLPGTTLAGAGPRAGSESAPELAGAGPRAGTARVSQPVGLWNVVSALHPSAAVCGTPTQAAYELIVKHESTERGRYSGPVGWMDARGAGACAIALRCGQLTPDGLAMQVVAGGGIMPDSQPDLELAETEAKLAPVLTALGLAKPL